MNLRGRFPRYRLRTGLCTASPGVVSPGLHRLQIYKMQLSSLGPSFRLFHLPVCRLITAHA